MWVKYWGSSWCASRTGGEAACVRASSTPPLTRCAVGTGEEELQRQLGGGDVGQGCGGLVQELIPLGSAHLQYSTAESRGSSGGGGLAVLGNCLTTGLCQRNLPNTRHCRPPCPAVPVPPHLRRAARLLRRRHLAHGLQRAEGQRRQRVPRALGAARQEVSLRAGTRSKAG